MGQPKRTLNKPDYARIARLGARGVNTVDIAKSLGMNFRTFKRILEEDDKATEAFEEARKAEEAELVGVLYELATKKKCKVSAIFLLKSRFGYRDQGADVMNASQVNVSIVLPGSKDPVQYLKEVEAKNES